MDDSTQARALASLCQALKWPQAVLLFEDTEYGHQFHSHLSSAFQDAAIGLVHPTAIPPLPTSRKRLAKLLAPLDRQETKVFIIHASPSLGFRIVEAAKRVGMTRAGSAWVVTDSLANFLSSMDAPTREAMEGVVGLRPHVEASKELRYFQERWARNTSADLNVIGLWAYDLITALATAVENLGPDSPQHPCSNEQKELATARTSSSYGSRLLRELASTRFRGLSGSFELANGRLKGSGFEIVNLVGTGGEGAGSVGSAEWD